MQESDGAQATALEQIDWVGAALSVLPSVTEWCNALKSTEAQGSFVGDAYEGGVKCTTWSVDDQAVAALVDAVLTEDVCAALKAVFTAMEMDADAILSQIREQNKLVAQENLHTYLLRWVQDAQDQPIGASLTVLKNGEQIATVSMGFQDDGCRLVIGLGLDIHTVKLVGGILLVTLTLKNLENLYRRANEHSYQSLQHRKIGLVAQHTLHSPDKSDIFIVF